MKYEIGMYKILGMEEKNDGSHPNFVDRGTQFCIYLHTNKYQEKYIYVWIFYVYKNMYQGVWLKTNNLRRSSYTGLEIGMNFLIIKVHTDK